MPIEVEVDAYSGRPNPRFTLPLAAAAELRQRLAGLPPAAAGAGRPRDGIGYRGLRIVGDVAPDAAEVVVSAGIVEIHDRAVVTRRADPGRDLERWLVERAVGQLPAAELEALRQDLAR